MMEDERRHGGTRRQALTFADAVGLNVALGGAAGSAQAIHRCGTLRDMDEHLNGTVPLRPVWLAS